MNPQQNSQQVSSAQIPVTVFWDIENCGVPRNVRGTTVVSAIRKLSLRHGLLRNISAVGNLKSIKEELRIELQGSAVLMHDVPSGKPSAADIAILVELLKLVCDHKPPHKIILISGDRDFSNVLNVLVFRGYEVILIHLPQVSDILKSAATQTIEWNAFLSSGEKDQEISPANIQQQPIQPPSQQQGTNNNPNSTSLTTRLPSPSPSSPSTQQNNNNPPSTTSSSSSTMIRSSSISQNSLSNLNSPLRSQLPSNIMMSDSINSMDATSGNGPPLKQEFFMLLSIIRSLTHATKPKVLLSELGTNTSMQMWKELGYKKLRDFLLDAESQGLIEYGGQPPTEWVMISNNITQSLNSSQNLQHISSPLNSLHNMPDQNIHQYGVGNSNSNDGQNGNDIWNTQEIALTLDTEARNLVMQALADLKRDQFKPTEDSLWNRLKHLFRMRKQSLTRSFYEELIEVMSNEKKLNIQGTKPFRVIIGPKGPYDGADPDNPTTEFSQSDWSALQTFLLQVHPVQKKGRFGFAQFLKEKGPPQLKAYSLGILTEMVQIAQSPDYRLIACHSGMLQSVGMSANQYAGAFNPNAQPFVPSAPSSQQNNTTPSSNVSPPLTPQSNTSLKPLSLQQTTPQQNQHSLTSPHSLQLQHQQGLSLTDNRIITVPPRNPSPPHLVFMQHLSNLNGQSHQQPQQPQRSQTPSSSLASSNQQQQQPNQSPNIPDMALLLSALHDTLNSLCKDKLKPLETITKARLRLLLSQSGREIPMKDKLWNPILESAAASGFIIQGEKPNRTIYPPSGEFPGVDPNHPETIFPQNVWECLESYLRTIHPLSFTSRYAFAQHIVHNGPLILRELSLGHVTELVQLALGRGLLVFRKPNICTLEPNSLPIAIDLPPSIEDSGTSNFVTENDQFDSSDGNLDNDKHNDSNLAHSSQSNSNRENYYSQPPIQSPNSPPLILNEPYVQVTFCWRHGGYKVLLTGSWCGWLDRHDLTRAPDGSGNVCLTLRLPPGVYQYKYIVDGEWRVDPTHPTIRDSHGSENNLLSVDRER